MHTRSVDSEERKIEERRKPNYGNSGLLAAATNTVQRGDGSTTVLKYNEPPEARKPVEHWRLYEFKDDDNTGQYSIYMHWVAFRSDLSSCVGNPPAKRVYLRQRRSCELYSIIFLIDLEYCSRLLIYRWIILPVPSNMPPCNIDRLSRRTNSEKRKLWSSHLS
jgi:hypothetical protein